MPRTTEHPELPVSAVPSMIRAVAALVVLAGLGSAPARADEKPAEPAPEADAKEPGRARADEPKADKAWADIRREAERKQDQQKELNKLKARAARAPRRRPMPGFVGPMFMPGMNPAQARALANARAAGAGAPMRNAADMVRLQQQFFAPNMAGMPGPIAVPGGGRVFGGPGWEVREFQGPGVSGFMMRWGN